MKFAKFWARGKSGPATVWRWSDVSMEDAQRQADARAVEAAKMFAAGTRFDRYSYGDPDRPLREQIVETVGDAVITRNLYGALVLNAPRAMFIDLDFEDSHEKPALDQLRRALGGLGARIYRTAAGARALVTSRTFDPTSGEAQGLLQAAGSDPLYIRLCKAQQSFRARLTPKPWRVELRPPGVGWPFLTSRAADTHAQWVQRYEEQSAEFSVCRLVESSGAVDPAIAPIIEAHDARALGDGPLA